MIGMCGICGQYHDLGVSGCPSVVYTAGSVTIRNAGRIEFSMASDAKVAIDAHALYARIAELEAENTVLHDQVELLRFAISNLRAMADDALETGAKEKP